MKNRKKIHQQKRIEPLELQIKDLEEENEILQRENKDLKRINQSFSFTLDNMRNEHDTIIQSYTNGISEIKQMKQTCLEIMRTIGKNQKDYDNKIALLIKRLKNQKGDNI